ncbi:MAG: hypothetical protein FWD71_12795 [Oscillospiraceae bacterium]|nr:hypothetical protein [Oscillospiraceae bacterium]
MNLKKFFYIFKVLPDGLLTFISGILLTSAINIATSQLPSSIFDVLNCKIIISMFLMFVSSCFFILLGFSIKPFQDEFSKTPKIPNDKQNIYNEWFDFLAEKKVKKKWSILLILSLSTSMTSIVLIII